VSTVLVAIQYNIKNLNSIDADLSKLLMNAIEQILDKEIFYSSLPSFSQTLFGTDGMASISNKKIYIFGFSDLGFQIANALKHSEISVSGYIDNDISKHGSFNNDIGCLSINAIEGSQSNSYVVLALRENFDHAQSQLISFGVDINNIFYKRADRELLGNDFFNYLTNCFIGSLAWENTTHMKSKILRDATLINETYIKLADNKSKELFVSRIALAIAGERYGPLTHFLNRFSDTVIENNIKFKNSYYGPKPMPEFKYYFNQPFLNLNDDEVYVDIGAEDGNTIIPFIERMYDLNKGYSKIFGFEPDPVVFPLLKRALGNLTAVTLLETAVGETDEKIGFNPSETQPHSRKCGYIVNNDANYFVPCLSLDSYFKNQKYTLVKFDPHGESIIKSLRGGVNTIRKYKPKIIAGTYHSIENFYLIPNIIWEINSEYQIFLRHLAFHANETHAFAILDV
jgi:FkbM family methyltransferase